MAVYDESAKALGKALEGNILTALSLYGNKPPMRAPRQWARSLPEEHQEGSMCEALHTARVINVNGKKAAVDGTHALVVFTSLEFPRCVGHL